MPQWLDHLLGAGLVLVILIVAITAMAELWYVATQGKIGFGQNQKKLSDGTRAFCAIGAIILFILGWWFRAQLMQLAGG